MPLASYTDAVNFGRVFISPGFINNLIRGKTKEQIRQIRDKRLALGTALLTNKTASAINQSRQNRAIADFLTHTQLKEAPIVITQQQERKEILGLVNAKEEERRRIEAAILENAKPISTAVLQDEIATTTAGFELGQLGSVTAPAIQGSTGGRPLPFSETFTLSASNQSYTAQGTIRIRVTAKLNQPFQSGSFSAQILVRFEALGVLKKQVRKNINFTPNSPQSQSVDVIATVSDPELERINYKIIEVNGLARRDLAGAIERQVIPNGGNGNGNGNGQTGTGRLEGHVVLEDNHQIPFVLTDSTLTILQNRFDELRLKRINVTNTSSELGTIAVNVLIEQIRQHNLGHNGVTPPPPPTLLGKVDGLVMGAIILGALIPLGAKKK